MLFILNRLTCFNNVRKLRFNGMRSFTKLEDMRFYKAVIDEYQRTQLKRQCLESS